MLKSETLYYLVETARWGSINKAAEHLYISQPALSIAIKNTENLLGVEIFHRMPKGVVLTNEGQKVVAEAKHILQHIYDLEKINDTPSKNIEILLCPTVSSYLTFLLEDKIKDRFPDVEFSDAYFDEMQARVQNNQHTFALVWRSDDFDSQVKSFSKAFDYYPICKSEVQIMVGNNAAIKKKEVLSLKDLQKLEFINIREEKKDSISSIAQDVLEKTYGIKIKKGRPMTMASSYLAIKKSDLCAFSVDLNKYYLKLGLDNKEYLQNNDYSLIPFEKQIILSLNLCYNKNCSKRVLNELLSIFGC